MSDSNTIHESRFSLQWDSDWEFWYGYGGISGEMEEAIRTDMWAGSQSEWLHWQTAALNCDLRIRVIRLSYFRRFVPLLFYRAFDAGKQGNDTHNFGKFTVHQFTGLCVGKDILRGEYVKSMILQKLDFDCDPMDMGVNLGNEGSGYAEKSQRSHLRHSNPGECHWLDHRNSKKMQTITV